jgi:hypothetical protein
MGTASLAAHTSWMRTRRVVGDAITASSCALGSLPSSAPYLQAAHSVSRFHCQQQGSFTKHNFDRTPHCCSHGNGLEVLDDI